MIRALFVSLVVGSCGVLQAAPLLYFTLEGRRQGTLDVFSSSVDVALGDVVEYRLQMRLAPPETENLHLTERLASPTREHRRLPGKNGANSLSVSIFQDPSDPIQVDLSLPVELNNETGPTINDGWGRSNFARSGQPTPRADSPFHDLIGIRPIQPPGVFVGSAVDETVFSGELVVAGWEGDLGTLRPKWGPTAGGLSFYGDGFYPKYERRDEFNWERGTEDSSDPLTHFTPLTLTASKAAVPEPSTIAIVGAVLIGLPIIRRGRQRRPRGASKN